MLPCALAKALSGGSTWTRSCEFPALIGGDSDDTSVIPREETPVHIWWRSSRGIGPIRLGHSDHTDQIAFPHPQK
jgi:hypothetical protein